MLPLLVVLAGGLARQPPAIAAHNPHGVAVTKIHMVVSSHFDGGCKTPGCGKLAPGEPSKCAKVGPHWPIDPKHVGEPWAYHIVNRYFDEFFPRAIALAEQGRQSSNVSYTCELANPGRALKTLCLLCRRAPNPSVTVR
jgi:hypothetical protein